MSDYIGYINPNDGIDILIVFVFLMLTLLLMGILKGLFGYLWCPAIGTWGLNVIFFKPRRLVYYYEFELRDRDVLYDSKYRPVHPDTGEYSVKFLHPITELWVNIFFFIIYPLALLLRGFQCCQNCYETFNKIKRKRNVDEIRLVDSNDCKNDTETEEIDTKYVLKKLQESRSSIDKVKSDFNIAIQSNHAVQYKNKSKECINICNEH